MPLPDTGPQEDGTRTSDQWIAAMGEDVSLIYGYLRQSLGEGYNKEEIAKFVALAQKEANRLLSDIRRFGEEVHEVTREDLEKVGPL